MSCTSVGDGVREFNRASFAVGDDNPDSSESGELARVDVLDLRTLRTAEKVAVDRFIQVPPKSRTITTRGSRIAPAPMVTRSLRDERGNSQGKRMRELTEGKKDVDTKKWSH